MLQVWFIPQKNIVGKHKWQICNIVPSQCSSRQNSKLFCKSLVVPEVTSAESAPDSMLLMPTQRLGERTAFHITQDSCLCLKQVVSKACWKGQQGLTPRAGCAMSLLTQDADSMQKWNMSSMEKDNKRKGSKGIGTQIISVQRRAWLTLEWRWNCVPSEISRVLFKEL